MKPVAERLAVLGDPLSFTRSPELHRAGLAALGLTGDSEAIRTPIDELGARLRELAARGWRGVNLTHPLKRAALDHLAQVSQPAARARSVNTVGFGAGGAWGDTTDGPGFVDWIATVGRDLAGERVVLLGAGGVARSIALAACTAGCGSVEVLARRPDAAAPDWDELSPARLSAWDGEPARRAIAEASVLVNATPLAEPEQLPGLDRLAPRTLVVDLRYGAEATPWVLAARGAGHESYDGLGMLVFQARRSLALWYGRPVPVDPLARAVGWPR